MAFRSGFALGVVLHDASTASAMSLAKCVAAGIIPVNETHLAPSSAASRTPLSVASSVRFRSSKSFTSTTGMRMPPTRPYSVSHALARNASPPSASSHNCVADATAACNRARDGEDAGIAIRDAASMLMRAGPFTRFISCYFDIDVDVAASLTSVPLNRHIPDNLQIHGDDT